MNTSVELKKLTNKRFSVKSKFDNRLFCIIKGIEKRYWDRNNMTWTLPLEAYDEFLRKVNESGFTVKEIVEKPTAFIFCIENNIELKFSGYIKNFHKYLSYPNSRYDADKKMIYIEISNLIDLIDKLKEDFIDYEVWYLKSLFEIANKNDPGYEFLADLPQDLIVIQRINESSYLYTFENQKSENDYKENIQAIETALKKLSFIQSIKKVNNDQYEINKKIFENKVHSNEKLNQELERLYEINKFVC